MNLLPSRKIAFGKVFLHPNKWKPPNLRIIFPLRFAGFSPFPRELYTILSPSSGKAGHVDDLTLYFRHSPPSPWRSSAKLRRRAAKFPTSPSPKRTAASLSLPYWVTMTSSSGWARMSAASTSADIFIARGTWTISATRRTRAAFIPATICCCSAASKVFSARISTIPVRSRLIWGILTAARRSLRPKTAICRCI